MSQLKKKKQLVHLYGDMLVTDVGLLYVALGDMLVTVVRFLCVALGAVDVCKMLEC